MQKKKALRDGKSADNVKHFKRKTLWALVFSSITHKHTHTHTTYSIRKHRHTDTQHIQYWKTQTDRQTETHIQIFPHNMLDINFEVMKSHEIYMSSDLNNSEEQKGVKDSLKHALTSITIILPGQLRQLQKCSLRPGAGIIQWILRRKRS